MNEYIEILPIRGIKCDAVGCGYSDPSAEDVRVYLNRPCPNCGANLLTEADLALLDAMIACVDWVNSIAGPAPDGAVRDRFRVNMDGSGVPAGIEALGEES